MALLAAALNDPSRSRIGNPRTGTYAVSLIAHDGGELETLERAVALLAVRSQTNQRAGDPLVAYVAIYDRDDQRRLLEAVAELLEPGRHKRLDDLVRARGPITPELLERIRRADSLGWSHETIATKLNEGGFIDGMGGKRWTPSKVKKALAPQPAAATEEHAAA